MGKSKRSSDRAVKSAKMTSRGVKTNEFRSEESPNGESIGDSLPAVPEMPGDAEAATARTRPAESESYTDRNGKNWPIHEVAAFLPPMQQAKFAALKASIEETGGNASPILLSPSGVLLDGRHRLKACDELGIDPRTEIWDGTGSEIDVIIDLNQERRRLNRSQQALVAARLTGLPRGRRKDNAQNEAFSHDEAAAKLGISRSYVQTAIKVLERAIPQLAERIERGAISLSLAKKVAELESAVQQRFLTWDASTMRAELHKLGRWTKVQGKKTRARGRDREEGGATAVAPPANAVSPPPQHGNPDAPPADESGLSPHVESANPTVERCPQVATTGSPAPVASESLERDRHAEGDRAISDGDASTTRIDGPGVNPDNTDLGPDELSNADETGNHGGQQASSPTGSSDEEWLAGNPVRGQLSNASIYDADVRFWAEARSTIEALRRLADESASFRKIRDSPAWTKMIFTGTVAKLLMIPHPRDWILCTRCEGRVQPIPSLECGICGGAGYQYR